MKNFEVGVRLTADGKALIAESRAAQNAIKGLGDTSKGTTSESAKLATQTGRLSTAQNNAARGAKAHNSSLTNLNGGVLSITRNMGFLSAGAIAFAGIRLFKGMIDESDTFQRNFLRTQAIIKATGASAGFAAEELREEARALARVTLQSTEGIERSQQILLTFRSVSGDTFKRATELATDLATVTGVGLTSAMTQLGKALEDPVQGVNALRRSGVSFTDAQREMIKSLVETNRVGDAQTIVLDELSRQYGGVAKAEATGYAGALDTLGQSWQELKLSIDENLQIGEKSGELFLNLAGFTDTLAVGLPKVAEGIRQINTELSNIPALDNLLTASNIIKTLTGGNFVLSNIASSGIIGQIFSNDARAEINETTVALKDAEEVIDRIIRPGVKPALPNGIVAELKRETTERARLAKARDDEARRAVDNSRKIVEAFKKETAEVGKNAVQKRLMAAATAAADAPTKQLSKDILASAEAWAEATRQQEALLVTEKARLQTIAEIERAEQQAARNTAQEWSRIGRTIEQTARSSFIQFATHGKSAMKSIGEAIKLSIFDLLFQLTVRPFIINIGTRIIGGSGGGFGSGGSNGGGFGLLDGANLLSTGNTIYQGFAGGFANSSGSIITSLGQRIGSSALTSFGAGLSGSATSGVFGPGGAAFLGGEGTAIGGTAATEFGAAATAGSNTAAIAGSQAIPIVGLAILANRIANSLLENDKKVLGLGQDTLNKIAQSPQTRFIQGLFGSGVSSFTEDPALKLITSLFGRGPFKQKETNLIGQVTTEGFSGITSTKLKSQGGPLSGGDRTKRILIDVDTLELAPGSTRKFSELADSLKPAVELLNFTLDGAISLINSNVGKTASELGLGSTAGFATNINIATKKGKFFTAEQITDELKRVEEEFIRFVLPSVDILARGGETVTETFQRVGQEFNVLTNLGNALGNSTQASQDFLRNIGVNDRSALVDRFGGIDALAQKTNFFASNFLSNTERLAPAQENLNNQLRDLGLSSALTKDRFANLVQSFGQLNGISEDTLRSMLDLAPAFLAVKNAQRSLVNDAFGGLQRSVQAERNSLTTAYNKSLDDVNAKIGDVTDSVGRLKTLSSALNQTVVALRPLSRDVAKGQIQDAINIAKSGGGLPQADDLRDALTTLARRNASGFSSSFEFEREQRKTANLVGELGNLAGEQLSAEEQSLATLVDQGKRLTGEFEAEIGRLDSIVETAGLQLAKLDGIDTTLRSIAAALSGFNTSVRDAGLSQALTIDPSVTSGRFVGPSAVTDQAINDFFSVPRTADEIARAAVQNNISSARIAQVRRFSPAQVDQFFDDNPSIKRFADGGRHFGGARIVGERGPEFEVTGPSQITSNNDLRKMMSNDDVVAKIGDLVAVLKKNNEFNQRVANKLDSVTVVVNGLVALRTGT